MDGDVKRFEFLRHEAGAELRPEHVEDFQRLLKNLRFGARFQLLLIEFNDWFLRDKLLSRVDQVLSELGLSSGRLALDAAIHNDFSQVEAELLALAAQHHAVHIIGGEAWFDDARLQAFNIRREAIAQACPARLLLWLDPPMLSRLAQQAPDWWAWRGGVFSFHAQPQPLLTAPLDPGPGTIDNRTLAKRSRRISELRAYLNATPPPPDDLALPLWDELAELLFVLGRWDEALSIRTQQELPLCERFGDKRGIALTQSAIANLLYAKGQWTEALNILNDKVLPEVERLHDGHFKASVKVQIANIFEIQGKLDEAIQLLVQEVLPLMESLGDSYGKAVAQVYVAEILNRQDRLEEALHLLNQVLPIFQQIGHERFSAIVQSKTAGILMQQGRLNEALELLRKIVIPIFERLGNQNEKAVAQSRIADIFYQQGKLDEALSIHDEELLPVYQRLGNQHEIAITYGKIADILQRRNQLDEALQIRTKQELPIHQKLGNLNEIAVTQEKIAGILEQQDKWELALDTRLTKQLPTYKRLGDEKGHAQTLLSISALEIALKKWDSAYNHLVDCYRLAKPIAAADIIGHIDKLYEHLSPHLKRSARRQWQSLRRTRKTP